MDPRRVFAPSLLRAILGRTLLVAALPLLILAVAVVYISDRVVLDRFTEESQLVAKTVGDDIHERVVVTTRNASLIAEIQPTREAIASGDAQRIKSLLLPLKSRLGLDVVNFADARGRIIAGAQDAGPDSSVRPVLLRRVEASVEQSWIIDEEPNGLTLRAVAPVRQAGELIGMVEVGLLLDSNFLKDIQPPSETGETSPAHLALVWNGKVKASTLDSLTVANFPEAKEIEESRARQLNRTVTLTGQQYHTIFSLIDSHQGPFVVLGVYQSLAPVEAAHRTILGVLAALLGTLIVAILVLAFRTASSFTEPLWRLGEAAQQIESGDLATRIERRSPHEIGTLERSFETMARSLEQREQANRALVAELQVQALNDALTSLPNRILLQDRLRQTILSAGRQGKTFGLFMMDLDRFKEINDTFGHQAGDRLLVAMGERIGETLRDSDTVARFGGDEFAVLLPTTEGEEGAVQVARKIQKALERPFVIDDLSLQVEGSIGITLYPQHGEDPSTLIKRADAAMYLAKRNKSGYAVYATTEEEESRDRLLLMGEFRQAIERDELVLFFQPEVEPRTQELVSLEALVRWQHPSRGILGPDYFIPFAEQTGLIRPLTAWVIDAALRQSSMLRQANRSVCIAVNLSARDFQDPQVPERVAAALRKWDVPATELKLEITESAVMAEPARSLEIFRRLREMGVKLSIDDFGTGYSSLAYLKRLPVDEIKIDRSFVLDITADTGSAAIVRSTIELAHSLGRTVVAEGVEDQATVDLLASYGCDSVQGYFFSKPLPASDVERRLVDLSWALRNGKSREPVPEAAATLVLANSAAE